MRSFRSSFLAMLALGAIVSFADISMAQPGGRGGRGFFGGGQNMAGLLRDPRIQEELELVDGQMEDLQDMQNALREEMMNMFRGAGFRDLSDEERREKMEEMRTRVGEKMKELDAELGEILLPHQLGRLKELHFQQQFNRGTEGLAENDTLAEMLDITDEQKEKMKEAAQKAAEKLEKKIAELRQQAQDEVLAVLTPEQRSKIKELRGDAFDFGNRDRGRGGDRGDRGGRGGDRGQLDRGRGGRAQRPERGGDRGGNRERDDF